MQNSTQSSLIDIPTPDKSRTTIDWQQIAVAIVCLTLAVVAYKCVVSKYFVGDDHVHLIWLRSAVVDPSLVLRNFYSNWLYPGTTPQCYRPLISVFMFTDYLLWHHNATGFHITNLVFHLIGCVALYGCVKEVTRWAPENPSLKLWPVLAAGTFALYPSHPEAVSWITGRVDTIVTAFYLLSVWSFMVYTRMRGPLLLVGAIVAMMLSLASKEMAVTIPCVFFLFELFKPSKNLVSAGSEPPAIVGSNSSVVSRLKNAFFMSLPAWGLLAAYFLLRRFALGTFVGGYDDTLAVSLTLLANQWSAGLYKFFVPINGFYATEYAALVTFWITLTSLIYLSSAASLINPGHRNQLLFFAGFAVVSFAPVYKLFNGIPDLQGSRFSYLASAPVAAIFAFGLAYVPLPLKFRTSLSGTILRSVLIYSYFSAAAFMLWVNNQPWMTASRWVGNLEKSFNVLMANPQPHQRFVYFNIPNNYRGAYLARNAVGDIGAHGDVDWTAIEPDDKHSQTGLIRGEISSAGKNFNLYFWDDKAAGFLPVRPAFSAEPSARVDERVAHWNASPLDSRVRVIQGGDRVAKNPDGNSYQVKPGATPLMVLVNLQNLTTSDFEFFRLRVTGSTEHTDGASLLLSNALIDTTILTPSRSGEPDANRTMVKSSAPYDLLFSTRTMPGWFGSNDRPSAVLLLPPTWEGSFSPGLLVENQVLPSIKGISPKQDISHKNPLRLQIDVSKIKGAIGAVVEISEKNKVFPTQNTCDFYGKCGKLMARKMPGTTGESVVKYSDLEGDGQYQIRCWAIGDDEKPVGISSDYIFAVAQKNAVDGPINDLR